MPQNNFPKLAEVNTDTVDTAQAAHYLNRSPQTLRTWACKGGGAIAPIRIGSRLAWPVKAIRLAVGAPS